MSDWEFTDDYMKCKRPSFSFIDAIFEIAEEVPVSILMLLIGLLAIATLPLWIIPYLIHKNKERGKKK